MNHLTKTLKHSLRALAVTSAFSSRLLAVMLTLSAGLLATASTVSKAQEFVWAPDFPVGSRIIEISAEDQNGDIQTFDDLKGEKGLLFMLSRSFNW